MADLAVHTLNETGLSHDGERGNSENSQDYLTHPSGFLALSDKNQRFTLPGEPGFIAYRVYGRHRISLAGIHAPESARKDLFAGFLEDTRAQGLKPLMVQLPMDQVDICLEQGMTVNQLGSTFALSLDGYSFAGTPKMKLRNKIKRARRSGLKAVELEVDEPWTEEIASGLKEITQRRAGAAGR